MALLIKCAGAGYCDIDDMCDFQGDLKTLSKENYLKFKNELLELGFSEPISVWRSPDEKIYILNGHQRRRTLLNMRSEGILIPPVPINFVDADDIKQAKKKVLALTSQWGEMTSDSLLDFCEKNDLEIKSILDEFRFPELEKDLENINKFNLNDDEFDPQVKFETDIKLGDLFQIGRHRLLCGDSTDLKQVEKLMEGKKADMVLTDPPYNVNYTGKTKDALKIDNDKMDDDKFYDFLLSFYKCFSEITKMGGAWYVWHADSEGANFRYAMEESGILFKQCLIWVKNSMVLGRQDYQWKHEPCLYGWKEGASHNWYSDRKQTTILNFDRPQRSEDHPTMKPVELFAYQIQNSSKELDIVADAFLGSGTTMVASEKTNRICYGMELDPKYCQVIIDRMKNLNPEIEVRKIN